MDNKNFLLAIILSLSFLFVWSTFVVPRFTPPAPPPVTASTAPAAILPESTEYASQGPAAARSSEPAADRVLKDARNEVVFSELGGGLRQWKLDIQGGQVDLLNPSSEGPAPLCDFPDARFTTRVLGSRITMEAALSGGLRLVKTLELNPSTYLHDLNFEFVNPTDHAVELKDWRWGWGPGLGTISTERKENARNIRALSLGKLNIHVLKPGEYPEAGRWMGIDNRYFLVAFLPVSGGNPSLEVSGAKDQTRLVIRESLTVPAHGRTVVRYQLYVGPKGYTQLLKYGKGLEEAVDFGFFSSLGKIVLRAIYALQRRTGNYGWAIIILTAILQVLLLPLTIKSFKAALAMKTLQPQIAALQKTYKNDPKRLNIEMMNLYKKSGTNPFGGCLPMLLQMPILWAFFTSLRNAYELHGAPFALWIHDLSAPDPLHALPIIMGGAMFIQQRMTGAVTDPTQKQMMYIMPIMFTVMFFNFPSGLVLYWLTNSLLTMGVQWGFQRYSQKATPGTSGSFPTTIVR